MARATPLVGRAADLRQLGAVLARAGNGAGSIVLISGEAGIGKTLCVPEISSAALTSRVAVPAV